LNPGSNGCCFFGKKSEGGDGTSSYLVLRAIGDKPDCLIFRRRRGRFNPENIRGNDLDFSIK
jgi:hypothetical protein